MNLNSTFIQNQLSIVYCKILYSLYQPAEYNICRNNWTNFNGAKFIVTQKCHLGALVKITFLSPGILNTPFCMCVLVQKKQEVCSLVWTSFHQKCSLVIPLFKCLFLIDLTSKTVVLRHVILKQPFSIKKKTLYCFYQTCTRFESDERNKEPQ